MTLSAADPTAAGTPGTPSSLLEGVDPAPLFAPFRFSGLELANRFVMAPMTRQFSPGGVPGPDVAAYYARRAAHTGLLITEGTYVGHPSAGASDRVPRFYGEDALEGWRKVADAVHAAGGRIMPQLWHLGATRTAGAPPHPEAPVLSPSGLRADGAAVGEPATTAELDAVVAAFAQAALDARRAGFDGVEIHGAHGYLLDQFLWTGTNRRADGYGGSLPARARLGTEVVAAIRDRVGADFPVVFRFSQWKGSDYDARIAQNPGELETLLTPLAEAGASAFHVSTRRYWLPGFEDSPRTLAGWTRKITGLPVIAVGSVGVPQAFRGEGERSAGSLSLAPLVKLLGDGELDLIAIGRALLSDPAWPAKVREGDVAEIRPYQKGDETRLY